MTQDGATNDKGGYFLAHFIGKDSHLIFEIETTKPMTLDYSDIIGEINILCGTELITIRVGQDEILKEKGLPQFRVEQFKPTGA